MSGSKKKAEETCPVCGCGYDRKMETLIYDKLLEMTFHKRCYEGFQAGVEQCFCGPVYWGGRVVILKPKKH